MSETAEKSMRNVGHKMKIDSTKKKMLSSNDLVGETLSFHQLELPITWALAQIERGPRGSKNVG